MVTEQDNKFMQRALDIAFGGSGFVNPNPLVGAVIVKDGKIIGEGYHEKFGEAHAEINAINNASGDVSGASLYVSLEPCSHQGKTPPCTDRIIHEKFKRVIIGMKDPNRQVNGRGIQKLMDAGIDVTTGVLEDKARKLNEVFIKQITTKKPFVVLKTAMSLDGKIASYSGDSRWISNEQSRKMVHELRHRYAGIMVGVSTVIQDDPLLTDRSDSKNKSHPVRIIVDSRGRTPLHSKILDVRQAPTILAITSKTPVSFVNKVNDLGVKTMVCPENQQGVDLRFLTGALSKLGIDSILLEGGSTLNFSALTSGIVDKVFSFISPKIIGGQTALSPVGGQGIKKINEAVRLNIENVKQIKDDVLIEAYVIK